MPPSGAAAAFIDPDDLAQLEAAIDVLIDPSALADIREADTAYARGGVEGVDAGRFYQLVLAPPPQGHRGQVP